MIWRTQQGEQPQRWAISALRTPPRDRRMTLACRRLTALDSCRFIACSFLPSQGRSVLATTVSTIGSPHHNGCGNNRWRTYLRSKAARWKPSVRPGESHELETALAQRRPGSRTATRTHRTPRSGAAQACPCVSARPPPPTRLYPCPLVPPDPSPLTRSFVLCHSFSPALFPARHASPIMELIDARQKTRPFRPNTGGPSAARPPR